MPLHLCVLAFMFCTYNGYLQSRYLSQYAVYTDDWVTDPRFLTGGCLSEALCHSSHNFNFHIPVVFSYKVCSSRENKESVMVPDLAAGGQSTGGSQAVPAHHQQWTMTQVPGVCPLRH